VDSYGTNTDATSILNSGVLKEIYNGDLLGGLTDSLSSGE
jgi:hypothetical protein